MKKLAHISDTHISYIDENMHGTRLVEVLKDIKEKGCDHVVITGDLVENPKDQDLQYVREILYYYGLLNHDRMSVVPGNHDIFGGAEKGIEGIFFSLACKNVDYKESVDKFIETFKETFPKNHSFPYLKILDNIALIGINSIDVWSESKNPEGSNGRIRKDVYKKLKKIFSSEEVKDKVRIVLMHHHLNKPIERDNLPGHSLWLRVINWKMRLYGRRKFIRFLRKNKVSIVLYGHTHVNELFNFDGISLVNSSTCVMPLTDDQIRYYNIISVPDENDADKTLKVETITLE